MFTCGPALFSPAQDIIHMVFETGNGSVVFTDTGTAASMWAGSSSGVKCTTATVLDGISSLAISGGADYLTSPYTTANRLPPSGNFDLQFLYLAATPLISVYLMSCQDASATAAGTAFAIATNSSQQLVVILSDGTTRSIIVAPSALSVMTQSTKYLVKVSRRGTTISLYLNGVAAGSGTFAGAINTPIGGSWRLNKPIFGSGNSLTCYFDDFYLTPVQ